MRNQSGSTKLGAIDGALSKKRLHSLGLLATILFLAACFAFYSTPLRSAEPRAKKLNWGRNSGDQFLYGSKATGHHFKHDVHLKMGLDCRECHSKAPTSQLPKDELRSKGQRCDSCHQLTHHVNALATVEVKHELNRCDLCHALKPKAKIEDYRRPTETRYIRFSHQVHEKNAIPCLSCHKDLSPTDSIERGQDYASSALPSMDDCMKCHANSPAQPGRNSKAEPAAIDSSKPPTPCQACHLSQGGKLRTTFPSGKLYPSTAFQMVHGPGFALKHGPEAGLNSKLCVECHEETECAACHDGRVRPRDVHPGDYLQLHALDSRQHPESCGRCHQAQNFCLSCHQSMGIAETSPQATLAGRGRVHPPRSTFTEGPMGSLHHGTQARQRLESCTSCHTERDCLNCHATIDRGSRGLNPHPPGFSGQSCANPAAQNPRACFTCHEPQDPKLSSCGL